MNTDLAEKSRRLSDNIDIFNYVTIPYLPANWMSVLCNISMGCVCVEGHWQFSRIILSVIQFDYVVSSCADWFFGVFSRFCSISRVFCLVRWKISFSLIDLC